MIVLPEKSYSSNSVNKIYGRVYHKKITIDEWNAAVAKAQGLLEQSGRGELTDENLKRKLDEL